MTDMNLDRMEELFEDEAFLNTLKDAQSAEDMVLVMAKNGVEISTDQAEQFMAGRIKAMEADELDEETLNSVAGGKSKCFFHGALDAAFGKSKDSDSGFWYKVGYAYGSLFR